MFGGYIAKKMGFPVDHFTVATNSNDALVRGLRGDLSRKPLEKTLSPSMDIVVSSNFERLLFDLYDRDGIKLSQLMNEFQSGAVKLEDPVVARAKSLFSAHAVDDEQTCETIARVFRDTGELLIRIRRSGCIVAPSETIKVVLATAHPAKFAEAVEKAGFDEVPLPADMMDLLGREEHFTIVENDLNEVQAFVRSVTG